MHHCGLEYIPTRYIPSRANHVQSPRQRKHKHGVNNLIRNSTRKKKKNRMSCCNVTHPIRSSKSKSFTQLVSSKKGSSVGKIGLLGLFWADFEPKIEWAPNVFWGGSEEVNCSLPRGKSHGEDGSSKPFMSEWEHDVVFGFVE
ncbi:hypothetical protein HYC85_010064 [Camellia sinensis]|uniref:Uncharacterized protein n=1 Tax=Camellia sinensis TaxID=4442 RepID=A0A7J7HGT5_CAMSI|nr:hypothetical protein HYC85_010064 [Camellia sinensis]